MKNLIEVEFDTALNANVQFPPLQRTLRGRFDVRRMKDPGRLFSEWPEPIPGQRLSVNFDSGECEVIEPLWNAEFGATRERIESKGLKISPGRESVQAQPATLHYWLKELIDTDKVKIVSGELPAKVQGTPQLRFHSQERPDAVDRLAEAIERQTAAIEKLLSKLAK
jgi:hypothetical protein